MIGIDLFSGAGGIVFGLTEVGFKMKLAVEIDSASALTLKNNNPNTRVVEKDIRLCNPKLLLKNAEIDPQEIKIISGGAPCQGFSQSNRRTRNLENPLNILYKDFFRFVKAIKPQTFLFENVEGLKNIENGQLLNDILVLSKKLGYRTQWQILSSLMFGVPQNRNRLFIIGTKKPASDLFFFKNKETISVAQAINDLPHLSNGNTFSELKYSKNRNLSKYQKLMRYKMSNKSYNNIVTNNNNLVIERYKHIPQGGNWKNIPLDLMSNYKNVNNCHSGIYYRLKWNEPSIVISNFRKNMLVHPSQDRGLSVREAARLQSFPDRYIFYGPLNSQQQQVANAVPPLMVKEIGENIKANMEGYIG